MLNTEQRYLGAFGSFLFHGLPQGFLRVSTIRLTIRRSTFYLYNAPLKRLRSESYRKPLPAANVPGKTVFERFHNAVRQVLTVSKEELLRREAREKRTREKKRRPKK